MAAQKGERSNLDLIGNVFLYLSLLGFAGGMALLGVSRFFSNTALLYGSQVCLLIAVLLPCYPFTSEDSYQRFLSRGAGGLLLIAAVTAVQFAFMPTLRVSTLLTIAALVCIFALGWLKTVPTPKSSGLGMGLLELLGAALTAFGAIAQPILVRVGIASSEGLGLYGLPAVLAGLLILVYVRIFVKKQKQ